MKRFVIVFILLLIVFSSLVYVDYFNTKTNNTFPKLALKSENDDAVIYTAVLYRVWQCKANNKLMIGSYTEDNLCPKKYSYTNGIYTNTNGVKISKRNLQLLSDGGVYTSEMIENMTSEKQVEDAVYVAYNYLKNNYKVIQDDGPNKIIVFPEYKEVDGDYTWTYDEETNYFCLSKDEKSYAPYVEEACGEYKKFAMDDKWCSLYTNSTLVYDEKVDSLCK